ALEEPYRSTLLARYFDELPPTEIARALDVSVETVKTRLKRGLAQLRERLDSIRPEGTTLEAGLLPLCSPWVGTVAPVGAKIAALAATLVLGLSITWLAVRGPALRRVAGIDGASEASAPSAAPAPVAASLPRASAVGGSSRTVEAPLSTSS